MIFVLCIKVKHVNAVIKKETYKYYNYKLYIKGIIGFIF